MKSTNTLIAVLALICCGLLSAAFLSESKKAPAFIDTTLPMWEMTKTHTLEVLDAMPEENFGFKPADVSMTFGEQMVHIAYTLEFFNERMIKGKEMKYEQPDAAALSKAEIRTMMEENMDGMISAISALSQEQLDEMRPFGPDTKISVAQVILFAHDHTTNHRAKANLYIRMNELDPPDYKFM